MTTAPPISTAMHVVAVRDYLNAYAAAVGLAPFSTVDALLIEQGIGRERHAHTAERVHAMAAQLHPERNKS